MKKSDLGLTGKNLKTLEKIENKKQEQERKVMVITPKVENIISITLNKSKYIQV